MKEAAKKGFKGAVQTFGEAVFKPRAEAAGFTFVAMGAGQQHGGHNVALAHYQLHLDGKVHADVLLMQSDIAAPAGTTRSATTSWMTRFLSVGQGAAATEHFGDKVIAGHGTKSLEGLHGGPVASGASTPAAGAHTPVVSR